MLHRASELPTTVRIEGFDLSTGARKEEAWMVSGNTFDFIGAMSFGMRGVFVKRSEDIVFDPWQIEPDVVVSDLIDLDRAIREAV